MQKVRFFSEDTGKELEDKINDFAKDKKILQISYSYTDLPRNTVFATKSHSCMVLYED